MTPLVVIALSFAAPVPAAKVDERPLRVLLARLASPKPEDRAAAASGLGLLGETAAVRHLDDLLSKEGDEYTRLEIANALYLLGHPSKQAGDILAAYITSRKWKAGFEFDTRPSWYSDRERPDFTPYSNLLSPLFDADDAKVRSFAASTYDAMQINDVKALPGLTGLLRHLSVRGDGEASCAASAIRRLGPAAKSAVGPLEKLLQSPNPTEYTAAASTLLVIDQGNAAATRKLEAAFRDADSAVQQALMWELWGNPALTERYLVEVTAILADAKKKSWQRARAASAIRVLGAKGTPALEALIAATRESDPRVKAAAVEAVCNIDMKRWGSVEAAARDVLANPKSNEDGLASTLAFSPAKLPTGAVALANEKYAKVNCRPGSFLAAVVLNDNPNDVAATAYLRSLIRNGRAGDGYIEDSDASGNRSRSLIAVRCLGRSGKIFRDDLIALLGSPDKKTVEIAAVAIRTVDAATRKGK